MITYIIVGFICLLIGAGLGFALNEDELKDYKKTNEILLNDINEYKAACDVYMNERNFYHDGYMILLSNVRELNNKLGKEKADKKQKLSNNNQPQINIIIDGKSIEEYLKKGNENG